MSSIRQEIDLRFRKARLERDDATKNVIGMLKNEVLLRLKSGKVTEESDELWLEVISAYLKQLEKAIPDLEKAGERGKEAIDSAQFEMAFCRGFLPTKLDEAATEALIRELVAAQGIEGPKQIGRLMGLVMKSHKDEVDGAIVRQVAQRVLSE